MEIRCFVKMVSVSTISKNVTTYWGNCKFKISMAHYSLENSKPKDCCNFKLRVIKSCKINKLCEFQFGLVKPKFNNN